MLWNFFELDIAYKGNVEVKDYASDTKVTLFTRRFCPETTLNNLQAQDQSLGLCLFLGCFYNLLWLERWTVNPYVAGSSPARGASFIGFFQQSVHALFLTVAKMSLTWVA